MKHRLIVSGGGLLCALFTASIFAQDKLPIDRYLTVNLTAETSQKNVLKHLVDIEFPETIQTVGGAMEYLLEPTGYMLSSLQDEWMINMLNKKLPDNHRVLFKLTIIDSLTVLSGEAFQLIIDPVHRLVSFQLDKAYQAVYMTNQETFV